MANEPDWLKKARKEGMIGKETKCVIPSGITDVFAVGNSHSIKTLSVPDVLPDDLPEETFQELIVYFAEQHGWKTAHCRKVKCIQGERQWWETPMAVGWFDLVLARSGAFSRNDRVYFVEAKTAGNVQTPEQKQWEKLMTACGQTCFLWYPKHWAKIRHILSLPVEP